MRELEEEVEELSAQLKSLRDSLEQETLSKVDLQNNIQSLKEKLAFDRRIHEEVRHKERFEQIISSHTSNCKFPALQCVNTTMCLYCVETRTVLWRRRRLYHCTSPLKMAAQCSR